MKKKQFTEEQIIKILKAAESGIAVAELCRTYGMSDATFYNWRKKYGGLDLNEMRRLKHLEEENRRLKKLLADTMLEKEAIQAALEKKW